VPIQVRSISRRRFLARSTAAGAGLSLTSSFALATKSVDRHLWALLSDPHLAADRTTVVREVNMVEHFAAVRREMLDLARVPAGVLINGDCAYNTGELADYQLLTEMLGPIRAAQIPIWLGLGNHDCRAHFLQTLASELPTHRPLRDRLVALVRTPLANWFVLDSLEQALAVPGMLGEEQLVWLANALDANRRKPALVLVHHNPDTPGTNMGLKDTEGLFQVLRPRKQVKALFFGHTHVWKVERDPSGIHLVNLPAVAYPFEAGQPTGWVLASLDREGADLELRCIDRSHPAHGQKHDLRWRS
jgi:hypothetical protein